MLGSPTRLLTEEDFHSSTVLQVISKVRCPVLCLPVQPDPSAAKLSPETAMVSSVTVWPSALVRFAPLCHPERSGGICGAPRLSHKRLRFRWFYAESEGLAEGAGLFETRTNRHPERSASQNYRVKQRCGAESKDPGNVCWQMH